MNKFMSAALKEASVGSNKKDGGPFGAVIVRNGIIIARAHNMVLKNKDATCHAEVQAIRQASAVLGKHDLSDCEIYTSCEPCPMCLGAILWSRLKGVYYGCTRFDAQDIGFDDNLFYDILKGIYKGNIMFKNIDRNKCKQLFTKWNKNKDKKLY